MSVIAIIAALVIEQWRPLGERQGVQAALAAWAVWLERSFNGGERQHGITAWLVGVLPPVALAIVLYALLSAAGWPFALILDIAVLYLTLGFRQFSHYFTDIQVAIKAGDVDRARALLEEWRGASGVVRTREEVVRLSIEEALVAAHRHVFGVLLWYLILPGPSGAILYRLAAYLAARWRHMGAFGDFSGQAFHLLDWPAVRLTAAVFALVGDFENTVYCWRTQARTWPDPDAGVLLAAGAGAMGVRLGMPVQEVDGVQPRPELGVGEEADGPFLDTTVGMLWRALVLWVAVLAGAALVAHGSRLWA
jgi:cobalamin biosynthesis protein CobD/CbiB